MSEKTLFTKIIDREIPGNIAFEDEKCIVIHDINPQAPIHLLIIPKKELPRIGEAKTEDQPLLGHLFLIAGEMAKKFDAAAGFRLVVNNGKAGGESVPHLHIHLLAGRNMNWPPG